MGSDFHLLFTCWVLVTLPAVSQSGGGAQRDRVYVGLLDGARVPAHLPRGGAVCVGGFGGLTEVCSSGWEKWEEICTKSPPRTGRMVSRDFPGAERDSGRGGTVLAWSVRFLLGGRVPGGARRKLGLGLCRPGREPVASNKAEFRTEGALGKDSSCLRATGW